MACPFICGLSTGSGNNSVAAVLSHPSPALLTFSSMLEEEVKCDLPWEEVFCLFTTGRLKHILGKPVHSALYSSKLKMLPQLLSSRDSFPEGQNASQGDVRETACVCILIHLFIEYTGEHNYVVAFIGLFLLCVKVYLKHFCFLLIIKMNFEV